MLAILDYKAGNQTSVRRALEHLGIPCAITADPATLERAHGIIFPGVGAAGQAMRALHPTGLDVLLREAVKRGQPLLGICLGCQIMLEHSEESDTATLGIFKGKTRRFAEDLTDETGERIRIPHMGWNTLHAMRPSPLLDGVGNGASAYFVHGYAAPVGTATVAACDHGGLFTAMVQQGKRCGAQFHPERSAATGARILRNFLEMDF